jgi:hypothetical protein
MQCDTNVIIKRRLNPGMVCWHSTENPLSSRLLYKYTKLIIYKNIILPVILYGCETWSLTLNEEHRLRVFQNKVLRRLFEPRRNGELHNSYSSPDIIRMMKWMRWVTHLKQEWG